MKLRLDTDEKAVDKFIADFMKEETDWCKNNRMFQACLGNAACRNTDPESISH